MKILSLVFSFLMITPAFAGMNYPPLIPGQIPGTQTNNNATSGNTGEFIESVVTNASPVSVTTTATPQNLTSISLTSGDWDVSGIICYNPSVSTSLSIAGLNTTTNTMPAIERQSAITATSAGRTCNTVPRQRESLNSTTTIFLVGSATFASGTVTMYGYVNARRVR